MLDQATFDNAEDIAAALHEQDGLEMALLSYLDGKLTLHDEHVILALIDAQRHCRQRACKAARWIAVPDKFPCGGPDG